MAPVNSHPGRRSAQPRWRNDARPGDGNRKAVATLPTPAAARPGPAAREEESAKWIMRDAWSPGQDDHPIPFRNLAIPKCWSGMIDLLHRFIRCSRGCEFVGNQRLIAETFPR